MLNNLLAYKGLALLPLIIGTLTIPVGSTAGAIEIDVDVVILTVLVDVAECIVEIDGVMTADTIVFNVIVSTVPVDVAVCVVEVVVGMAILITAAE